MEAPQHKRMLNHAIPGQHANPDIASLATLGMRIRKSVADGYSTSSAPSYRSDAFFTHNTTPEVPQNMPEFSKPRPTFSRVPMANNMQPPSLTNEGSTFQSGLNVGQWGAAPPMPMHTLAGNPGVKRRYDDEEMDTEEPVFRPILEPYSNGDLRFDEDF